ncbi:MAG: fatty acid desaturase [Spirosomataceae bacterium]
MSQQSFEKELYQNINQYFESNQISRYANKKMLVKVILACVFWVTSIILLFLLGGYGKLVFFLLYVFHCFSQLFILLNIAHDANHGAIFKNKILKKIMPYSFDLCGVNSYMWRQLHHAQHHNCMNIDGEDETLVARKLFRFSKKTNPRFIHQFQHFYFLLFYGLFTADWVFFKDFECFFFPHTQYLRQKNHPPVAYHSLFIGKSLYIGYMIILPIIIFNYSFWLMLFTFIISHFLIGIIGGTVIQITHPLSEADFPESKKEYQDFARFVFATTADYSINSKIADWFFGGLHLHVAHHLCPNVCHVHYKELTKIIAETSARYRVKYRVNRTMFDAVKDHYMHLKSLSTSSYATN